MSRHRSLLLRSAPSPGDAGIGKVALILGLTAALGVGSAGAALVAQRGKAPVTAMGENAPQQTPTPSVALAGLVGTAVEWQRPLTLAVTNGTLSAVEVTGPDGAPYAGTLTEGRWTGARSLLPDSTYAVRATVTDLDGKASPFTRSVRSTPAATVLKASVEKPAGVVGVAQPVIVRFNEPVKGAAARSAVLSRLQVTTAPAVQGAWRWYNSYEVHYRAAKYWTSGTTVDVAADLSRFRVPGTETWGAATRQTGGFTVGSALVSTADIAKHTLTVTQDGKLLRVLPMSAGSDKYPTKGGVHIVLLKEKVHTFNSATIGIPTGSPDGYYTKLPWSVRISNGGAFVHSQPGSIRSQGIRNVSHGCINLNPANAEWFFGMAKKGDVVNIVNAVVKPTLYDAGMADWNYSWETWQQGNLDG